jgi:hypothetical protein
MNQALATDPVTDSSGNNNHGAATGTTIVDSRLTGKNGRNINGLGDIITVAHNATLSLATTDFTIATWVKYTSGNWSIAWKGVNTYNPGGTGYELHIQADIKKVRFALNNGDAAVNVYSADISALWGNYLFIVVTADRDGNAQIYVNNSPSGAAVDISTKADISNNANLIFGKYGSSNDEKFDSSGIMYFNSVLDATQRINLYSYFADSDLVAGSVCIRKWATTTNPAHSSVGPETEYSYSGEEGYYYQKYYYPNYHAQKKIAESKATTRQHELREQAQKIVSNQVTEEYNKVITQNKRLMK